MTSFGNLESESTFDIKVKPLYLVLFIKPNHEHSPCFYQVSQSKFKTTP